MIPMGEAYYKIKRLAESGQVIVFSSNYRLYGDLSNRVMKTLQHWTPHIEIYSIDEAFLDLTNHSGSIESLMEYKGRRMNGIANSLDGIAKIIKEGCYWETVVFLNETVVKKTSKYEIKTWDVASGNGISPHNTEQDATDYWCDNPFPSGGELFSPLSPCSFGEKHPVSCRYGDKHNPNERKNHVSTTVNLRGNPQIICRVRCEIREADGGVPPGIRQEYGGLPS